MPKVWFVAIIGRPNAGKSTLINALIGEKVSAVSPRPQTTQRAIVGILTDESKEMQIIFLDTPGIHQLSWEQYWSQKNHTINDRINYEAFASLRKADVIVRLIDPTRPTWVEDARIDEVLSHSIVPVLRVETKQDVSKKINSNDEIDLKIDSVSHTGFTKLIDTIVSHLPEWPYLYDPDFYTDQAMDFRIQEVIREQLFLHLGKEIPYACYIEIGSIENNNDILKIQAYINVESNSQKTILIGKKWEKITTIGTFARLELERIFGKKVFLWLRVKVQKNWRKNQKTIMKLFPKQ